MLLRDPDTFVQWTRTDEPGDNPRWESQCGVVEQIGFGNNTMFQGFVGPKRTKTTPKPNLNIVKTDVEIAFEKSGGQMKWVYDEEPQLELHRKPGVDIAELIGVSEDDDF
jgi:hypothetical protein